MAARREKKEEEESESSRNPYEFAVVPCSSSRNEEEELKSAFKLDNLNDELLIEVLLRLPTAESAMGAALVCKRWRSLICENTGYFASRFISHHINLDNNYYYRKSSSSVFISKNTDLRICYLNEGSGDGEVKVSSSSKIIDVQASCNDVLFCHLVNTDCYYIYSLYTGLHLPLPPPPPRQCYHITVSRDSFAGLVCEPNFRRFGVQGQQYDYRSLRFQVVRFFWETKNRVFIDTYCSETGQWNESLILDEKRMHFHSPSNVVAYDGKLHWYDGTHVVAYDPFNDGHDTVLIGFQPAVPSAKPFDDVRYHSSCLGICQGLLRFMLLVVDKYSPTTNHLSVWEFEDHETSRFSLLHKIYFNTMIPKDPVIAAHFAPRPLLSVRAKAFHPDNKDVLFLRLSYDYIRFNIQSRELELIGKNPYQDLFHQIEKAYQVLLPWWPTPVVMLSQGAHLQ